MVLDQSRDPRIDRPSADDGLSRGGIDEADVGFPGAGNRLSVAFSRARAARAAARVEALDGGGCMIEELPELTGFLFEEAELVDSGRFDEWLSLLSDDIRYRVFSPIVATGDASPALLFDEDVRTLRSRVRQLSAPESTIAENPRSIDRRFVANVRASYGSEVGSFEVRSNVLLRRTRGGGGEPPILSAAPRASLRRVGGAVRPLRRTASLDDVGG